MMGTLSDFRHGFRVLRRNRGFAALAIMTLALGIGATSAIFSVVDGVLLRPLPFRDPGRLVSVWGRLTGIGLVRDQNGISPPEYIDLRTRNRIFEDVAAYTSGNLSLTGEGEPERLETVSVTAGFFHVLGVPPIIGRTFTPEEDRPGSSNVVIMSHELWRRRFASYPPIVPPRLPLAGANSTLLPSTPAAFP